MGRGVTTFTEKDSNTNDSHGNWAKVLANLYSGVYCYSFLKGRGRETTQRLGLAILGCIATGLHCFWSILAGFRSCSLTSGLAEPVGEEEQCRGRFVLDCCCTLLWLLLF
ncbi:hypothetical protein H5410_049074 [Solanum commersonii]|uniref:Uncharacterized protein n=1 Tax=Solanum commersonii TaxID=4109 RepID=A0A9J5XNI3_SOLCO|nr:hypothetical protein H5410_049074 [Solanum commersonii]